MITVSNVSLNFSGEPLFKEVNVKFTEGNCYGVIGANGAGKSTFLKILSGELDSTTGDVSIKPGTRMSVLKQDHFAYDDFTVLDTIIPTFCCSTSPPTIWTSMQFTGWKTSCSTLRARSLSFRMTVTS